MQRYKYLNWQNKMSETNKMLSVLETLQSLTPLKKSLWLDNYL